MAEWKEYTGSDEQIAEMSNARLNQSEKVYDVKDDLPKEPNLDLSNAIGILTL